MKPYVLCSSFSSTADVTIRDPSVTDLFLISSHQRFFSYLISLIVFIMSLRNCHHIADNPIRQASIYSEEKDVVDLNHAS
ncbi:hypothetical protein Bca101_018206 [Brassica carinata]